MMKYILFIGNWEEQVRNTLSAVIHTGINMQIHKNNLFLFQKYVCAHCNSYSLCDKKDFISIVKNIY